MTKNSGYIVETKDGRKGRTYHNRSFVNGKVPVYLCIKTKPTSVAGIEDCEEFSTEGMLCDPKSLTQIGFID